MAAHMNVAKRCLPVLAALLTLGASPIFAQDAQRDVLPPELEATVAESHDALHKILNGDPSGYAALFAHREDITLGSHFGPFGKGRVAVLAALNYRAIVDDGSHPLEFVASAI